MKSSILLTIGSCILLCIFSFLFSNSFFPYLNQTLISLTNGEKGGGDPTPLPPNPPPPPPGVSMVIQFV